MQFIHNSNIDLTFSKLFIGHIFSVLAADVNQAISMATPVLATQLLFSGFFIRKAMNTPEWLVYFRYLSIFNYSYDLMTIFQWEHVLNLKCEYDLDVLCVTSGISILQEEGINVVIY